ncbi:hypothetical protein GGG16DRAFT_85014 [Schizophyllum commune]
MPRPSAESYLPPPPPPPTIRLISSTPSATGLSASEPNSSVGNITADSSWASVGSASGLAPKPALSNTPRRRLVPKKSKLGLLNKSANDENSARAKDLSDVYRRVGASSLSQRGGFDIYVDSSNDPELGEILMVKKQKSRAGLNNLAWGPLGEKTNIASTMTNSQHDKQNTKTTTLKPKTEENVKEKWWTIGRGRKDSKDKEAKAPRDKSKSKSRAQGSENSAPHPPRSKTPEPLRITPQESRARFNSLDSGILLNSPATFAPPTPFVAEHPATARFKAPEMQRAASGPAVGMRSATPTMGGFLAPPSADSMNTQFSGTNASNQGSVALRAIRSMKSLARIGSWAQLRNDENMVPPKDKVPAKEDKGTVKGDKGTKSKKALEKEKKKKSKKEDKKEKPQAPRHLSTSSFEAGALSASPEKIENTKTLGARKRSILGLGLPSSMRLPTVRGGSTASSIGPAAGLKDNNRLSVESAAARIPRGRDRAGSVLSTASSLRPPSTASGDSRLSSGSSFRSVRWDDRGLQHASERIKKDRQDKRESVESQRVADVDLTARRTSRESKHSAEGRRRTPLSAVLREMAQREEPESPGSMPSAESMQSTEPGYPLVTVEEATSDGHSAYSQASTPVRAARRRPVSEQLLGRSRPQAMHEDGEGVISVLDAATNDLAQLITTLDLEATPSSNYDVSPWRTEAQAYAASQESPLRRALTNPHPSMGSLRPANPSIQSLRPYAQSRGYQKANKTNAIGQQIGQQIAPWSTLNNLSPLKEKQSPAARRLCQKHNSSATPSPASDGSPVFQPLRPARSRPVLQPFKLPEMGKKAGDTPPSATMRHRRGMSSTTFGSPSTSTGSKGSIADFQPPVFTAPEGKKASTGSRRSRLSQESVLSSHSRLPITSETKRVLGMSGTMGGSDTSAYRPEEMDHSDPDSDIPEELQVILHNSDNEMDDTMSFPVGGSKPPPSPGLPPELPLPAPVEELPQLPMFRLNDEEEHTDIEESSGSEDDTRKSFDFTGELQALNESGGSDRRSFVEQLENAFRTPAKVDFTGLGPFLDAVPPVPPLPPLNVGCSSADSSMAEDSNSLSIPAVSQIVDARAPTFMHDSRQTDSANMDMTSQSQLLNMKEPTFMPPPECSEIQEEPRDEPVRTLRGTSSSSSAGSRPSDGQLNRAFKFGGLPSPSPVKEQPQDKPLTLSDIIPPPSHVRSLSNSSQSREADSSIEDDSVLKSIFAKATNLPGQDMPRVRTDSSASSQFFQDYSRQAQDSHSAELSRPASGISFTGFDSFEEVRRGFEFNDNRPAFYPPPSSRNNSHNRHESLFSIASVSSYGGVINSGVADPFGFAQDMGLPSLRERPSSEDMSMSMSMTVDDTFSFLRHQPRRRVDSDASSFYYRPTQLNTSRGHRRRDSAMSAMSQGPPISLYNRSFAGAAHRRKDSDTSMSSMAHSYAMHGANGGRMAWATRHRQEASVDSIMSDFSAMHLGRPGIGDKMFDTEVGQPLAAISASPGSPGDSIDEQMDSIQRRMPGDRYSYDSILDDDHRYTTDSILEKTDDHSSISDESVFGYHGNSYRGHLLPPNQFRPLSMISNYSMHSPAKDDDTMITMLGGGHVRRRSIDSLIEASPCVGIGKRKHLVQDDMDAWDQAMQSPTKARILSKPSIASTSSHQFGDERMIRARHGLLERQSLEESVLIAEGEDLSASFGFAPVFSRPGPKSRSRSSTYTASSGTETPPLSASDGSSISDGGSQSSIDLSQLSMSLTNATHPITRLAGRSRPRGHGHRRRASRQAHISHISRSSVYETIEEESSIMMSPASSSMSSSVSGSNMSKVESPTASQPVYVVDADDTRSIESGNSISLWDDDRGIIALRKYYALRDEADSTVAESKRIWMDTPFSMFALQSFDPPRHPAGMQALLEHSIQNYVPLPADLRAARARIRTESRPSPYPQRVAGRISKQSIVSLQERNPSTKDLNRVAVDSPLREVTVDKNASPAAVLSPKKKNAAVEPSAENAWGLAPDARPKIGSAARRAALGWTKRSNKSSAGQKENVGQGTLATPGDSLRINRARPRARQTPATQSRPIRI